MPTTDFLVTSLIVVLIPGTGVIYTVATGLFLGWRASVLAAVGCTAGIVPHLLASVLGLAALLHVSALAFQVLKFAGVAYLLYLAWGLWRDTGTLALNRPEGGSTARALIVRGFLLNILNPKLSIFFLAFLPQFIVPQAGAVLPQMLLLSAVFMAMTFAVFVVYGALAHRFSAAVAASRRVQTALQRGFAAAFAALAGKLALADR